MDLYPFQAEAARCAILGAKRHLCVSPTGTGKSHILAAIVDLALSRGMRTVVMVHRVELLAQTLARLEQFGFKPGVIQAGKQTQYGPLMVAMAQTARRRFQRMDDLCDLAILDEAHRDEFKVIHQAPPARVIGLTATPVRVDRPLSDWFDELRVAITYPEAIQRGHIVRARVFAPSIPDLEGLKTRMGDYDEEELALRMLNRRLIGDVVSNWLRLARGEKTIAFCVNVAHAQTVTKAFQDAGVSAHCVTGDTPAQERATAMARFRAGTLSVLVNVAVYVEGIDVADASCVIVARPTRSLALWMQMAGRGCRAFPGKDSYRVLDHGANVFQHGSPSDDRPWSLDFETIDMARRTATPVRYCKFCFYVFSGAGLCPNCRVPNVTKPVRMHQGNLEEVKPEAYKPMDGFINAYERSRRKAFAEGNARGMRGQELFRFVARSLKETVALQRKSGQVIIPKNPMLLF